MKKLLAVALALMMIVPMVLSVTPAFAADENAASKPVSMVQGFNVNNYAIASGYKVGTDTKYLVKNPNLTAKTFAVAEYAGIVDYDKKNYEISYDVELTNSNKFETMTMFYWQDYGELANGNRRTYSSEGKCAGAGFYVSSDGIQISFSVLGYDGTTAYKAAYKGVQASGSDPLTNTKLLEGAGEKAKLAVTLKFDYAAKVLEAIVSRKDNADVKTTVKFDLTGTVTALDQVTKPEGIAFVDMRAGSADAIESVGNLVITSKGATSAPVDFVQGFNVYNYAKGSGFKTSTTEPLFVTKNPDAKSATVLQYAGNNDYDKKKYEVSYEMGLSSKDNTSNSFAIFYWQDWCVLKNKDGAATNNRTYASEGKCTGAVLNIVSDGAKITFSVIGYGEGAKYNAAYKGKLAQGSDPLENTTLLAGAEKGAKLKVGYAFDYNAKTLDVVVSRVDDEKISTTLKFDLTGTMDALKFVTDPQAFAIVDNKAGSDSAIESIGNIMFSMDAKKEEGETEIDGEWAYSKEIPCNTEDWELYVPKALPYEGFSVSEDGYFTRKTDDSVKYPQLAYAFAKYKGFQTEDYKLEYNIRLNEENRCRVASYLVWDDVDYWGMQKCNGFAFYTRIENGLIYIVGVKYLDGKYKGTIHATDETAPNAAEKEGKGILAGQPANAELKVTSVVKGDKVSVSVALANDPTKTTGTVIYDLSTEAESLAQADRTERFGILDGACEYGIMPASIGKVKLYTTTEPPKETEPQETEPAKPVETTKPEETTTKAPETTTEAKVEDTTKAPETTAAEKKGCGSSITAASFAIVATVATSAVAITKKRKKH